MRIVRVELRGVRLCLPAADNAALIREYANGIYERPLLDEYSTRVRRSCRAGNDVVIDVGAHVGLYAVLAAMAGARVVAIEPNAETAALLRENARDNGVADRIHVVEAALADREGEMALQVAGDPCANHLLPTVDGGVRVRVRTLDALVDELGVAPRIVKTDAEGMDYDVLLGARRTLAMHDPWVIAELHPAALRRQGRSAAELLAFVDARCRTRKFLVHEGLESPVDLAGVGREALERGGNLLLSDWIRESSRTASDPALERCE